MHVSHPNKTIRKQRTKSERNRIKMALGERYGWVCWYCGQNLRGEIHIDHIEPLSLGGIDEEANMALACSFCNYAKQDYQVSLFLDWLDGVRFGPIKCPIREHLELSYGHVVERRKRRHQTSRAA